MRELAKTRSATGRAGAGWVLVGLALVLAVGCGSVPRRHYYTIDYPQLTEPEGDAASLHPLRMRIRPFKVGLPYNRPQIVYRQSPFEFRYYTFRMWAAKPQHMLRALLEEHFTRAKLVAAVSREYGEQMPDYELGGEVVAIEEFDSGDVWYGHLAMRFELVRFADKVTVWSYAFDRKRKVYTRDPVYIVRAISAIAEEELARVTAELDGVLSAARGVPATLVPRATGDGSEAPPVGAPDDPGAISPDRPPSATPPAGSPDDLILPDEPGAAPSRPGREARTSASEAPASAPPPAGPTVPVMPAASGSPASGPLVPGAAPPPGGRP